MAVMAGVRPLKRAIRHPLVISVGLTALTMVGLQVVAAGSTIGAILALGSALLLLALATLGMGRLAEVLVLVGIVLVPMNDITLPGAASFVTAADTAFVLGFALMVPGLVQQPLRLPPVFVLGAAGVTFTALISSLLSETPGLSFNSMARLLVGAFLLTTLILWWNPDLRRVVVFAWAYVIGNVISVAYAPVFGGSAFDGRKAGLTEHPNIFGLCALLALALIPFIISQTPRAYRWLPVVAGLVCMYGIWISGSRGAFAAMFAVALIYPALTRSVPAVLFLLAGFAVAVAFAEPVLSESSDGNALGRLLGRGSASGSDTAREQVAARAADQFQAHPILGVGLADVLAAHVIYLQIAAGLGVVGLTMYLVVLWSTARPSMVLPVPFNLLGLPALAYVSLGFVTPVLWDRYIWAVLALSLVAHQLARDGDELPVANSDREVVPRETARTPTQRR